MDSVKGTNFKTDLIENLKNSKEATLEFISAALDKPDLHHIGDNEYLIEAFNLVLESRNKHTKKLVIDTKNVALYTFIVTDELGLSYKEIHKMALDTMYEEGYSLDDCELVSGSTGTKRNSEYSKITKVYQFAIIKKTVFDK